MNISNIDLSKITTDNKWVNRIFANLQAVAVVDGILYAKYIGKEETLPEFKKAYKEYLPEIGKILYQYDIISIKSDRDINPVKLAWLKELIEVYQPQKIEFSIKN